MNAQVKHDSTELAIVLEEFSADCEAWAKLVKTPKIAEAFKTLAAAHRDGAKQMRREIEKL